MMHGQTETLGEIVRRRIFTKLSPKYRGKRDNDLNNDGKPDNQRRAKPATERKSPAAAVGRSRRKAAADVPQNEGPPKGVEYRYAKPKGGDGIRAKATMAAKDETVETSRGDKLKARAGKDYILDSGGNRWVVRGDVFDKTYKPNGDGTVSKNPNLRVKYFVTPKDTTINTFEGPVPAKAGDYVMVGAVGEMWPLAPSAFGARYTPTEKPGAKPKKDAKKGDQAREPKERKRFAERQPKDAAGKLQIDGEYVDPNAKGMGVPKSPRTLPAGHPLLKETIEINTPARTKMRTRIVEKHFAGVAPVPEGKRPVLIVMGGGGGAGKGTVLNALAKKGAIDKSSFVKVDPDDIKMKQIPEFQQIADAGDGRAASIVHEESSMLAKTVRDRALGIDDKGKRIEGAPQHNLILDVTLSDGPKGLKLIRDAQAAGFEVRMIGVLADVPSAVVRASKRGARTGRYVPIGAQLDGHRGFAKALAGYVKQADQVAVYVTEGGKPVLLGRKGSGGKFTAIRREALLDLHQKSVTVNTKAQTLAEIYDGGSEGSGGRNADRGMGDRRGRMGRGARGNGSRGAGANHSRQRRQHRADGNALRGVIGKARRSAAVEREHAAAVSQALAATRRLARIRGKMGAGTQDVAPIAKGDRKDLTFRFEKREVTGRYVWGWASVCEIDGKPVVDTQGDLIEMDELRKSAHDFMSNAREAKAMHEGARIGEVVESVLIDDDFAKAHGIAHTKRGWWIGMRIDDPGAQEKIAKGEWRAFSIGGSGKRTPIDA